MKGVVFNVVEEVVVETLGLSAWDAIVGAAGVDGAYTSLGTYDDVDLAALVGATAAHTGLSQGDVLRLVGDRGFARLAERVPDVLASVGDWRSLLRSVDLIVHAEVDRRYPDAVTPRFDVTERAEGMVLVYRSPRALCALADGLARGGCRWFGAVVEVDHLSCSHLGDDHCELLVREVVADD